MKRVMMIGTSENSGGGISSVIKLFKKMPIWEEYSCYWLGTQIQRNKLWKLWYAIKAVVIAPLIMWKYDIIHFHIVPGITLLIQLPELLTAKLYGKKIIIEIHVGNQLIPYSTDKFFKWWLKQADLILLLAHKWKHLFKEAYKDVQKPVQVLYNACETVSITPFEQKKKLIIFAGTIHNNKAPDLLLKAWVQLKEKHPEWRILFLGNGDILKYQEIAERLGVNNCVEFIGYVTGKRKTQIFNEASIYCMCSYEEGFPMTVLEAWTYRIAVVTTPVGGLPDVIEEGVNCLTFPFGDFDKLALQLDRLICDEQFRKYVSYHGYKYAQNHFSLNIINEHLEQIYSNLLRM